MTATMTGKVALVTGASGGIGLGRVSHMHREVRGSLVG